MDQSTDVLMITYNRPHYTRLALGSLLERCDASMRIWVWHNGNDEETLEVVHSLRHGLHRFHHSPENLGLRAPTNWLFENAHGRYLSKVDDDCIVPERWGSKLRVAHQDEPRFGIIGCWRFHEEDFNPELAQRKIIEFRGGHRLLVNLWVEGSGYLMKRECVERFGTLRPGQTFTDYCIQVGRAGWINGWIYPFLYQEHMDDPRSAHSGLKTDADIEKYLPLSAKRNGVTSIEAWLAQLRRSAQLVQQAPADPAYWSPYRRKVRNGIKRLRRAVTGGTGLW